MVLRREIYALASLAGAALVALFVRVGEDQALPMIGAALLIFVLRMLALQRKWSAPTAKQPA